MIQKPRNQMARKILKQNFPNPKSIMKAFDCQQNEAEFMHEFLNHPDIEQLLKVTDNMLAPDSSGRMADFISHMRPKNPNTKNTLELLSDVWTDLEACVMQTSAREQPEAHELYDLLAETHVRQFLVACDDVANENYDPDYAGTSSVHKEIYTEPETKVPPGADMDTVVGNAKKKNSSYNAYGTLDTREDKTRSASPNTPQQDETIRRGRVKDYAKQLDNVFLSDPYKRAPSGTLIPQRNDKKKGQLPTVEYAEIVTPKNKFDARQNSNNEETVNSFNPMEDVDFNEKPKRSNEAFDKGRKYSAGSEPAPGSYTSRDISSLVDRNESNLPNKNSRSPNYSPGEDKENFNKTIVSPRKTSVDNISNLTAAEIDRLLPTPGKPRVINLRREHFKEPLGFTISTKDDPNNPEDQVTSPSANNEVIVQRIMAGSLADRSGLLFPGDELISYNGANITSLSQAHSLIQSTANINEVQIVAKAPTKGVMRAHLANKSRSANKIFIKTFFAYDPKKDELMPTGDVGLSFKCGEILELVNSQDSYWWQVRRLSDKSGKARLIPSLMLEEKRQASENSTKKTKSIKKFFSASDSTPLLVRSDLWIYEEVVPWPPCILPCLLLIGPNGVGKRTLKEYLALKDPKRFAIPITDTTDENLRGQRYRVIPADKMIADIKSGQYVEWGSVKNHHYGIRYASIREIISRSQTAIMDCELSTVHLLHQPEFNPLVVFVSAPNNIEDTKRIYQHGIENGLTQNQRTNEELMTIVEESETLAKRHRHLYDSRLINDDMMSSVDKLANLIYRHAKEPGWIPAQWSFQMSIPAGVSPKDKAYLPGSSSLSALGISSMPPGQRTSIIAKTPSIISGGFASEMSATRLAQPPSIISNQSRNSNNNSGRRIYEKRKPQNINRPYQPSGPPLIEQPTPSESMIDSSMRDDNNKTLRTAYYREESLDLAENRADFSRKISNSSTYKAPSEISKISNNKGGYPSNGARPFTTMPARQDDDISSTSSED